MIPDISISDYQYPLPDDRIALFPVSPRDSSKLLYFQKGEIHHKVFRELPHLLEPGTLLVFNNTRVVPARLVFTKDQSRIEAFLLEPGEREVPREVFFDQKAEAKFSAMIGNKRKWKEGELLSLQLASGRLNAELLGEGLEPGTFGIRLFWEPSDLTLAEVLEQAGHIPLPPYIKRDDLDSDRVDYQTVYAKENGAVAAPTAGLHFTPEVINTLKSNGVHIEEVTLHVGAGTFAPVKADKAQDHAMHAEQTIVHIEFLKTWLKNPVRCTAVGTTSMRTLESLYWLGVKVERKIPGFGVEQFDPYTLSQTTLPSLETAIEALVKWADSRQASAISFPTRLMIMPGYTFMAVNRLITNFHQPGSTLMLLVGALVGDDWKKIYEAALANNYRFLSYGDSSLLEV